MHSKIFQISDEPNFKVAEDYDIPDWKDSTTIYLGSVYDYHY